MRFILLLILAINFFESNAQLYDCEEELFPKQDKQTRLWGYVNFIGEWRVDPVFIKVYAFEGKNAVVMKGTKFGVLDCSGKLVVSPVFDQFASFSDGKGWARSGNLWGLIDRKGKVLISPTYDEVREVNPTGIATWVRKGDKWGLMTKETGRFIIPLEYDNYQNLSDSAGILRKENNWFVGYYGDGRLIYSNLSVVKKLNARLLAFKNSDKKWGVVDVLAYTVVRPEFDSLYINGPFIVVKSENKFAIRNLRGQALSKLEFEDIKTFVDGASPIKKEGTWGFVNAVGRIGIWPSLTEAGLCYNNVSLSKKGGKWGLYSLRSDKPIVPFQYQEGLLHVEGKTFGFRENGKLVWFDVQGNKIDLPDADSMVVTDPAVGCRIKTSDGWGYFNLVKKQKLNTGWFVQACPWETFLAKVKSPSGWGVISESGKWIVEPNYETVRIQEVNGKAYIHIKAKEGYGITTQTGKLILPPAFENIWLANEKVLKASRKGKWGLVDVTGNAITSFQYEKMSMDGIEPEFPAIVVKSNKQTLLNEKGIELIKPDKVEWKFAGQSKYAKLTNSKWSFFNANALPIGELEWDNFRPFVSHACEVQLDGKWGFVGANGKILIPPTFEDVSNFVGNVAYFKLNGKWGAINRNGKVMIKLDFDGYRLMEENRRELYKN